MIPPRRIFITGCAKSGTTLLGRLFLAFQECAVAPQEVYLGTFLRFDPPPGQTLVAKRHTQSTFSTPLKPDQVVADMRTMSDAEVVLVYIVRDGRDVVCSDGGYVPWMRWVGVVHQRLLWSTLAADLPGPRVVDVRYENLLRRPDEVQERMVELGLTATFPWSAYPAFVPEEHVAQEGGTGKGIYRLRPLDPGRADTPYGSAYLDRIPAERLSAFRDALHIAGYDPRDR